MFTMRCATRRNYAVLCAVLMRCAMYEFMPYRALPFVVSMYAMRFYALFSCAAPYML
jgi:hypothetical protein